MNFIGLLLTLFVGLFILLGCVFASKFKNNKRFTDLSISLAFGVIIALIIFELLPEVYEILNPEIGLFNVMYNFCEKRLFKYKDKIIK